MYFYFIDILETSIKYEIEAIEAIIPSVDVQFMIA